MQLDRYTPVTEPLKPDKPHNVGCGEYCYHSFKDYLITAAPDILWFSILTAGGYSGSVYGVGVYNKRILLYVGSYGSCSGCGAWGEGGEPKDQNDVLAFCETFTDQMDAISWFEIVARYDTESQQEASEVLDRILQVALYIKTHFGN